MTADADGQHDPDNMMRVASELGSSGGALVLGVRTFGSDVPWKSRLGNNLTRVLMGIMVGQKLADAQTGLRGVLEALGMWAFPDERPLDVGEVVGAIRQRGEVLEQRILWPLVLTQAFVVARKRAANPSAPA